MLVIIIAFVVVVRRAFLCGDDPLSGVNYDHCKAWILERLYELADVFAIKICAYALMSNHYHLVLYVDEERSQECSDDAVWFPEPR